MDISIGLTEKQRHDIASGLKILLADSYTLYLKTHNFHWNVTGPNFSSLHQQFETQYTELAQAVDDIAERIRALGEKAPGSYKAYSKLSTIHESEEDLNSQDMIRQLIEGQEAVVRTARKILPIADSADDEPTLDLLTQRMYQHEKIAWMLRSMLED